MFGGQRCGTTRIWVVRRQMVNCKWQFLSCAGIAFNERFILYSRIKFTQEWNVHNQTNTNKKKKNIKIPKVTVRNGKIPSLFLYHTIHHAFGRNYGLTPRVFKSAARWKNSTSRCMLRKGRVGQWSTQEKDWGLESNRIL